ncbi:hypothetical protein B0H19DRAFT_1275087 [Mycena capillaripes]|nr:hypothetical protein B0H19DRAFT_1275087 [Mycena capillaripes]
MRDSLTLNSVYGPSEGLGDDGFYTGIRQFHQAKGFDPWTQELATEFGYPLFKVSCEQDDLFAHLQESDTDDCCADLDGVPTNDDIGSSEQYESADTGVEDIQSAKIDLEFGDATGQDSDSAVVAEVQDTGMKSELSDAEHDNSSGYHDVRPWTENLHEVYVRSVCQWRGWSIVMWGQLALILTLGGFAL